MINLKIKPTAILTPDFVEKTQQLATEAGRLQDCIIKRIDYIMQSAFHLFEQKSAYWYFYGAGESEIGDLWSHYTEEEISVIAGNCSDQMVIILNDGSEWGLEDSIPTRWLYQDFIIEMTEGKEKYQQKLAADKTAAEIAKKQKAEDTKKLAETAIAKLSKAELAALKKVL